MDLRQLRYFTQVVESGSFSKAAHQLRIAQPALSQHVRSMEKELGVTLLHRGVHGVVATEAGEQLAGHAKRILAEFAKIPDSVCGKASSPRGEVRVGLPGTVSEILAAPLIEAARERYPDIRIRVVEAMSGYILDWLRRGSVDLAIIYGASDPKGLRFHYALSEEICLFADASATGLKRSDSKSVRFSEVASLPLIVPGPGHGLRELIDNAALSAKVSITPVVEIDSYGQIKKLASRGLGYGILPRMAISEGAQTGTFKLWRIERPSITRKVYLAYSTERPLLNASRAIGQMAWDMLQSLVRDGAWAAELLQEEQRPELFG